MILLTKEVSIYFAFILLYIVNTNGFQKRGYFYCYMSIPYCVFLDFRPHIYFKKTKPSNENQYQKSYTLLPGDSSIITQLFGLIILQLM